MNITNGEGLAPRDRHFPCRVNPRPEACGSWEETVETAVHFVPFLSPQFSTFARLP